MAKIPLRLIPEPEEGTRSVIIFSGEGTVVMQGPATGRDYVCARCGSTILAGIPRGQIQNMVFKCASCGAFNETTD